MVLASLHISGRCVEIMSFNGSMNGGIYSYRICLVIMCKYLAASYSHVYLVACNNMPALLHAYLVGICCFFV